MADYDKIIVGGGFFGMYIAEYFAKRGDKVLLCEKEDEFLKRASYANQARVHSGYHYPRSVLTALRSRVLFPKFCDEFSDCIDSSFDKIYATGKILGKVTASQFEIFCRRIGAYCEPAPAKTTSLFNSNLIDGVFSATEYAFDAVKLRDIMLERINLAKVQYKLNTTVETLKQSSDGELIINADCENSKITFSTKQIFNCTYSLLNKIPFKSNLPIIPLKHELTEMCIIDVPEEFKQMGITIMCGPFFSVMPFPSEGLHSLSHVRYTPHFHWQDQENKPYINAHKLLKNTPKKTAYEKMIKDAVRYIPSLANCRYNKSLWEVKTILPLSEVDDSRPILFKAHHGIKNLHCIMGGKIDNIYDAIDYIEKNRL